MTGRAAARVLIAEDSASQAARLRSVLEGAGYLVETARDGGEGLRAFLAGSFDLVLSDVLMPGLTGYELCRAIKADPRGARVPFVLLTSLSKPIDLLRGLECGADNYIYKPFEPDALIARIETILGNESERAEAGVGGDRVCFMGHRLVVAAEKQQILDYLGSTFDDFARSRQREYDGALAREKQRAQAETYRLREELLSKEKENLGRLHAFVQSTLDALAVRIAILDGSGVVLAVNAAWGQHAGVDPLCGLPSPVGTNYLTLLGSVPADRAEVVGAVASGIREVMELRTPEFSREYPGPAHDGRTWFNVRITRFGEAERVRVVVAHEDITSRKAAEEQLLHEAYHDALTGLPNRARFNDRLGRAVARARSDPNYRFAVLLIDLDGFKVVNDSLGHMAGDHLLMGTSQRLESSVRSGDTVARLGGDEFAILVHAIRDMDDVLSLVDRIRRELEVPFLIGGHDVFTSASIGIAVSDPRYERPVEIFRDADTAMYRAKDLGKAHHVVFDQAMHTSVLNRLRLESDLRRALERNELWVAYQPIVELSSGRIAGFEALVRWAHPERGQVSPGEFIPAAEETGLVVPLDLWVMREACRRMRRWHERYRSEPPLFLSVNLSTRHFVQPNLVEHVDSIVTETGISPACLKLEVTESVIMAQPESAAEKLNRIRERGFHLSLDDFGTGYSSLSYLQKFPFDTLKIDRSFVSRIGPDGGNSEIVATIIALAHNLGMTVVAEGVESGEQAERLEGLGCEFAQGYRYARPLSATDAEEFLERQAGRAREVAEARLSSIALTPALTRPLNLGAWR